MSKEQSLDDILNDEPIADEPETATEAPEPEASEAEPADEISAKAVARKKLDEEEQSDGPVRDEKGRFAPKGEKEADETPQEAPPASEEQGNIPIAALKDERAKRQALENELNQLRQQMMQAQQQPRQPESPPDRWEDPEGYDRWLMDQVTQAAEQRAIEAFNYQRIATAATQFMADKPDYQETINVFGQMANVNPGLVQQMQASENPAKFAYETAKQAIAIQSAGSLDAYIQQRAEQLAAEKAAAQQQQFAEVQNKLPSAPPTITTNRSVGPRSGPQWQGPPSLDDILNN